ncbi:MAG TPA: hypothetical protein VMR59_01870 [Patescibacteria group bacterium]|jgi:hypothetical protein|nr:hypothetical protein [Patescibacteria group bacterium]
MNPKTVNDLDPKLKETYERVMGTSFEGNTVTPPAPTMETQPISQPELQPQPETPAPSLSDENSTVSQVFRADSSNKSTETATVNPPSKNKTAVGKGANRLLPIIIVGVVVFFAAYAVIWAKLLGLF